MAEFDLELLISVTSGLGSWHEDENDDDDPYYEQDDDCLGASKSLI